MLASFTSAHCTEQKISLDYKVQWEYIYHASKRIMRAKSLIARKEPSTVKEQEELLLHGSSNQD